MKKEKVKLNDKVKNKGKGINIDKYESEEAKEVKRFIIILFGIIILVLGVYGVTKLLNKDNDTKEKEVNAGVIDYDVVSVGTILNKPDKEYYVIVYDGSSSEAVYYSALVNIYMNKEDSLPVFFCNLNNALNKAYYVGNEKSNKGAKKTSGFAFGDLTLLKIKNGEVVKYIESLDTIKEELNK